MSLTQYCLFINNHVGKAAGRMLNLHHCEILRTLMIAIDNFLHNEEEKKLRKMSHIVDRLYISR